MRYCLALLIGLAACANEIPNTDHSISTSAQSAPFPQLVPINDVLIRAQSNSTIKTDTAALQNRAARLRQKANALRGRTIIDGQDRIRALNRS